MSRYKLGRYVDMWYCDASEEDVERIISNFKVASSQIFNNELELYEDYYTFEDDPDFDDGWDW